MFKNTVWNTDQINNAIEYQQYITNTDVNDRVDQLLDTKLKHVSPKIAILLMNELYDLHKNGVINDKTATIFVNTNYKYFNRHQNVAGSYDEIKYYFGIREDCKCHCEYCDDTNYENYFANIVECRCGCPHCCN